MIVLKVSTQLPYQSSPQNATELLTTLLAVEMAAAIRSKKLSPVEIMDAFLQRIEPALTRFVERSLGILAIDYIKARWRHMQYGEGIRHFFEKYDLLLTLTVAVPPFEIGIYRPKDITGTKIPQLGWMPFAYPFNITKQPAT